MATTRPTNKVAAAGLGGALSTVVIVGLELAGVSVEAELAAAIATLTAFGAGYLKVE